MSKSNRRFTKEFEEEALRLIDTSGRTQREIAEDLGVASMTLRINFPRLIDQIYNSRRLHSAFDYLSPVQFEHQLARRAVKAVA